MKDVFDNVNVAYLFKCLQHQQDSVKADISKALSLFTQDPLKTSENSGVACLLKFQSDANNTQKHGFSSECESLRLCDL